MHVGRVFKCEKALGDVIANVKLQMQLIRYTLKQYGTLILMFKYVIRILPPCASAHLAARVPLLGWAGALGGGSTGRGSRATPCSSCRRVTCGSSTHVMAGL